MVIDPTARQLEQLARARAARWERQGLHPCGTWQAAQRHRRRGEPVCEPCRLAYNAWMLPINRAHRRRWGA